MTDHTSHGEDDINSAKEEFWYPVFAFTLAISMVIMTLQNLVNFGRNFDHEEFCDFINNSIDNFNASHIDEMFTI